MTKNEVLEYFGRIEGREHAVRECAKVLGCSVQYIYQWSDNVPDSVAYKLQVLTNNELRVK